MLGSENKYLKGVPPKYFQESNRVEECDFCKTRMIHPSERLYICPNEKCQFTYRFYPESKNKTVVVLKRSNLEAKH